MISNVGLSGFTVTLCGEQQKLAGEYSMNRDIG
jgi:hypothetical protein